MSAPGDDRNPLHLPEEEQVVYELGVWSLELQAAASEALAESEIPHAYSGTDLVVHVDWEEAVDALLEEIEQAAGGAVDDQASDRGDAPAADGGDEQVDGPVDEIVYELDEWNEEQRGAVADRLTEAGIEFRWEDETSIVVAGHDEAVVEAILDAIEFPDAVAVELVDDDEEAADESSFEVLSSLFLAADRLKGNPLDAAGLADLTKAIEDADPDVPPYGITPGLWRNAVEQANGLADAVTDEDDDASLVDAIDKATALRDLLRPYI